MISPILDRLNTRIAAEPALTDLDTLFKDLADARDEIIHLNATTHELSDKVMEFVSKASAEPSAVAPGSIDEVRTLLMDAQERLAVNAIGSVATYIEQALRILQNG